MPRRCSVAGCRSNYDKEKEHTHTFGLPKSEPLRSLWLKKIPTDLTNLKDPRVCIKHFKESDIIWTDQLMVGEEIKEFPRTLPKYKDGAIPTIFQNLPKYLSTPSTSSRRLADVEKANLDLAIKKSLEDHKKHQEKDLIHNLDSIVSFFKGLKQEIHKAWIILKKESKMSFCLIDTNVECPIICGGLVISEDLTFSVYIKGVKVDPRCLPVKDHSIASVSTLENLVQFIEGNKVPPENNFYIAIESLKLLPNYNESVAIQFLVEQLALLNSNKNARRYTNQTMIFASYFYAHSILMYNVLYNSKVLCLPHPKNLQKVVSRISLNSASCIESSLSYLETRKKFLLDHELLVILHIDEIYIQSEFQFKGGCLYGQSASDLTKTAKTAQVFMISSLLSKYKDVVTIIPVNNLTSDQLKDMCLSVLCGVEKLGFSVLTIVSDNSNVNRKTFELFSPQKILQTSVVHPCDENRRLFFIFDTVHILKCIRNNWITRKDGAKTLHFPDINNQEVILKAQFKHLELLYELEKTSLVKYGHGLSLKALYPSGIQKQNVNLALKIFSENNIVALKYIAKEHPQIFGDIHGTTSFLDIVIKFWKITNVKSVSEGHRFNDVFREPIRSNSTLQIEYLKKLSLCLKIWRQSVPNSESLTAQTLTNALIDMSCIYYVYVFRDFNL